MGNQACCTNNSTTPDLNNEKFEGETVGETNNETIHTKVQAENVDQEEELARKQKEEEERKAKEEKKKQRKKAAQKTAFPDVSEAQAQQNRANQMVAPLDKAVQKINEALDKILYIYDPSEQIIALKQESFLLQYFLQNLARNFIGIYEIAEKVETHQYVEGIASHFEKLTAFLSELQNKTNEQAKTEGQTTSSVYSELLAQDENFKIIKDDYLASIQNFNKEFNNYVDVRTQYETNQNNLCLNARYEIDSYFPAYIRKYFQSHHGFVAWSELFNSTIDVNKAEFSEKYAQRTGLLVEHVSFILKRINSVYDTISFFEFIDFVQNNKEFFTAQGYINNEKMEEIKEIAQNIADESEDDDVDCIDEWNNVWEYPNDAKYTGEIKDKKRQGNGILEFNESYKLEANFVDDLAEGQGTETKFGVTYTGNYSKGDFTGKGKLTYPDGTTYEGNFQANKFQGEGVYTNWNGTKISGNFNDGVISYGTITYTNGEVYEGKIKSNRLRHGIGSLKCAHGKTIFEGEFENDSYKQGKLYREDHLLFAGSFNIFQQKGEGDYSYKEAKYIGQIDLITHSRNGQGVFEWGKEQVIDGTWENDAPVRAKCTHQGAQEDKPSVYEGQWKGFNREGDGTFEYPTGAKYSGQVLNNLRHGRGTYTFPNKNVYEGQWENNDFNGEGTFTFANGDIYQGNFKNGNFQGQGKYTYSKTGNVYDGEWAEDKWNGQGKYTGKDGNVIKEGQWLNDKFQGENPV